MDLQNFHLKAICMSGWPYFKSFSNSKFGAKIIAEADAFDAITTDRPYQKGRTFNEAINILTGGRNPAGF